jgi:hypothetical protein
VIVVLLQAASFTPSAPFMMLGFRSLLVMVAIGKIMPANSHGEIASASDRIAP